MKIKLSESKLKQIIAESVKKVLKENNEDVITIGSPEYGEKGFRVELGNGGLYSVKFNVYAYNEQDALDAAVDYAERKGWNGLFWDEDEEFEARASMLFDLGSTDFIHEESIVTIASVGVDRLIQVAGLNKASSRFDMK